MNDLRYQCSSIPAFADCFIKTKVFKNGNIEASVLLIMGGLGPVGAIGGPEQQYALKWNDFHASILSSFRHLRDQEDFIDVTIACDGCSFTAHKVVLSACSPYFRSLLKVCVLLSIRYFKEEQLFYSYFCNRGNSFFAITLEVNRILLYV